MAWEPNEKWVQVAPVSVYLYACRRCHRQIESSNPNGHDAARGTMCGMDLSTECELHNLDAVTVRDATATDG